MIVHDSNEERLLGLSGLERQFPCRVFVVSTNSLLGEKGYYNQLLFHQNDVTAIASLLHEERNARVIDELRELTKVMKTESTKTRGDQPPSISPHRHPFSHAKLEALSVGVAINSPSGQVARGERYSEPVVQMVAVPRDQDGRLPSLQVLRIFVEISPVSFLARRNGQRGQRTSSGGRRACSLPTLLHVRFSSFYERRRSLLSLRCSRHRKLWSCAP